MGDVVRLFTGRRRKGARIPKPVICPDCDDPIETARLQALESMVASGAVVVKPWRCISCAKAWERRFERQMQGVREHQTVEIIR
jgi:RNA polymerase-binding transcription factor DksA